MNAYNGYNPMQMNGMLMGTPMGTMPMNGIPMNGMMNGMPIINPLIGVTGTNQIPMIPVWQNNDPKISNNLGFQMNPVSKNKKK
jgi:hypothetical protein